MSGWRWASGRPVSATRPRPEGDWKVDDLAGRRIATAYPNLVREDLAARGIEATVIRLDGAVEISIQLGVADAIADVVGSGRTLNLHNLVAFGETLCDSEAVLIEQVDPHAAERPDAVARDQLVARVQGVVFGQQYLMLDYDCPRSVLDDAMSITPGLESPTIAPLADPDWVAVRAHGAEPRRQRDHGRAGGRSGPKRSWHPTSGSSDSDHECPGGTAAAVLASR
jgi:ATP phosphoribosyltransferase